MDCLFDALVLDKGTFSQQLFAPDLDKLGIRAVLFGLALASGLYADHIQRRAKQSRQGQERYQRGLLNLDQWSKRLISSAGQPQEFFDRVCDAVTELVNADLASFPMIDASGESFTYVGAAGTKGNLVRGQSMPLDGGGLCGWVAKHGESLRVDDLAEDQRVVKQMAQALNVSTGLLIPVFNNGKVIGGLSAFRANNPFDSVDEQLLTLFAYWVDTALDQLNLLTSLENEKERALITLQSIGDGVITTDPEGHIEFVNPVADAMIGYTADEVQGRHINEVFFANEEFTYKPLIDPFIRDAASSDEYMRFTKEGMLHNHLGEEYAINITASQIRDRSNKVLGFVLVVRDITETRRLTSEMAYQASHDTLTGLVNRREFEQRLEDALVRAAKDRQQHALLYLDLDQFKVVNDTCGHMAGDELLKQMAAVLTSKIRRADTLGRLGGDEFGVLLEECDLGKAERIAEQLRQAVKEYRFVWEDRAFEIGVSIGMITVTASSGTRAELLSAADVACYAAKDAGRNRIHVYALNDSKLAQRHGEMLWVSKITEALENDRFRLYYQAIEPIGDLQTNGRHFEVLIRMQESENKVIQPGAFLSAAERYNLSPNIDRWVLKTMLTWLVEHPAIASTISSVSINLSGLSIGDDSFLDFVFEQFKLTGSRPEQICFEVTETAAIANFAQAAGFVAELKKFGCRFALDDFGSGMSSFAYLKNLEVDYLKIDGMFVKDIVEDPIDYAMVKSINEIGHVMGKQTIAEFVENDVILAKLRGLGVDFAQGYGIAKPAPLSELESMPAPEKENPLRAIAE
jgi:diguanylate cyclase (GGDEF)-like protein/PAS domain S-box-containing protein